MPFTYLTIGPGIGSLERAMNIQWGDDIKCVGAINIGNSVVSSKQANRVYKKQFPDNPTFTSETAPPNHLSKLLLGIL